MTVAGLSLALLAGYLVTQALNDDQSDDTTPIGSSGGCFFAPVICPGLDAAGGPASGSTPGATPTPPDALAGAPADATPGTPAGAAATAAPTHPPAGRMPTAKPATPVRGVAARLRSATTPPRPPAAVIEYWFSARWDDGYVARIRLTNTSSSPWDGWQLAFVLGDGSRVSSYWDTRLSGRQARLRAVNEEWNGAVDPGSNADFGFEATGTFQPSECVLNGQPCRFSYRDDRYRDNGYRYQDNWYRNHWR